MDNKIECKHYRISQMEFDFEKLEKGKQNVQVEIKVSLKIPDEADKNKKSIVEIAPIFSIGDHVEIIKVKIQGQFELLEDITDKEIIGEVLEKEAVPFLYLKLQNYIDEMLKLANINFTGLPPYQENEEE